MSKNRSSRPQCAFIQYQHIKGLPRQVHCTKQVNYKLVKDPSTGRLERVYLEYCSNHLAIKGADK